MSSILSYVACTENDPEVDTPDSFKLPLYDYQKKEVYRILDIEAKRYVAVNSDKNFNSANPTDPIALVTSSCRMDSPYGSGKSIIALAVIASRPPNAMFNGNSSIVGADQNITSDNHRVFHRKMIAKKVPKYTGFRTEIVRKYEKVIPCSIIVVCSAVFNQWIECISTFTNMKVYAIKEFHSLKQFYELYKNDLISSYDIIIIKNGSVTSNFRLDDEPLEEDDAQIRPIINVVGKILKGAACSWLFYDDFDTIRLPAGSRTLNALFTIYVSTSNNQEHKAQKTGYDSHGSDKVYRTINEMILDNLDPLISLTTHDTVLNSNFAVHSDQDFIEARARLPKFTIKTSVSVNPNNKIIGLFGAFGTEDGNVIMEALNADAINTVAEQVGIKCDPTPSAIFEKLLNDKYTKYEHDCLVLDCNDKYSSVYPELELPEHPKEVHTTRELDAIKKKIIDTAKSFADTKERDIDDDDIATTIEYSSDAVEPVFEQINDEFSAKKEIDGRAINNVKENLREGECGVCLLDLDDIVIVTCCNHTVCGSCIKDAFKFRNTTVRKNGKSHSAVMGKCPHCMANVDISKDLIYITRGIDIDELINASGVEVVEEIEEESEDSEEQVDIYQTENPKLKNLYDIIHSRDIPKAQPSGYVLKNLLNGPADKPWPITNPKKVLVFANYNETIDNVADFLTLHGIKHMQLQGSPDEITALVNEFRDLQETSVMLINSNKICAGLNLQFCSDIVFFHRLINQEVEAQVAGRAQRVGREFNLGIWFLLYENEQFST